MSQSYFLCAKQQEQKNKTIKSDN